MQKDVFTLKVVGVMFAITLALMIWDGFIQENRQLQLISAVCTWSVNGDTSSERSMCGVVENATNTEFLCSNDFNCWAEQK